MDVQYTKHVTYDLVYSIAWVINTVDVESWCAVNPQHAVDLTSEEVLRLVVMPDEQGRYHFDEMGYENLPEYLGYLVGYLAGPLVPNEA